MMIVGIKGSELTEWSFSDSPKASEFTPSDP